MAQLYAACRQNSTLVVRHVQLNNQLQQQLEVLFQLQDTEFMNGINSEVDFTGDWKPDSDELLVVKALPEAQVLLAAAAQNAIALPPLDAAHFSTEGIKALFTVVGNGANQRLLIQSFSPQQFLSGRIAVLHDGNVFRRLIEPVFSLDNKLVATVDPAGNVRFKSFMMLRRIFEMAQFFRQATDVELAAFCVHASLSVADANGFVVGADEGIRKSVHAITASGVLVNHAVPAIAAQAAAIGFAIGVNGGKIVVPPDRKGAKALLSFLLDKVYLGPMNQQLLISNSTRPLN